MSESSHQASGGGRSRGRARARGADGQATAAPMRRPGPSDVSGGGRGRGVSVERPGPAHTEQPAAPAREGSAGRAYHPQQPTVGTQSVGRALHRGGPSGGPPRQPGQDAVSNVTDGMANLQAASPAGSVHVGSAHSVSSQPSIPMGRGSSRGRREHNVSILRTRPDSLVSKKGKGGKSCNLMANFFALTMKTDWRLMQYRVDFKPEEDRTFIRKMLLRDHQTVLPKYMFDGTLLYTTTRLTANKETVVLNSKRRSDDQMIEITIKEVGEMQPSDSQYVSFFNMVLRQCLERLNLQLLGRNYYDPSASKALPDYKLEMWPGYETSIRQHENEVLMCCDVSTKVLRTDTVLQQLGEFCKRDPRNFKSLAEKSLLGAIVITRYNNKTYRIDEICWDDVNVNSVFEKKDGSKIDYKKYYLERYGLKVTDTQQPLLVSMPKLREARGGVSGPVYLVPEFCNMTGLSDEQRANFHLMKAMADYTRQTPDKRVDTLKKFSDRINKTAEVKQLLESWNLQFSTALQKFNARILDPEEIYGKTGFTAKYQVDNADWGNAFRKWQMVSVAKCSKWCVIFPPKDEKATKDFVENLINVGPSLGFLLGPPKYEKLLDTRPATYIQSLDRMIQCGPQMVMVVIPNNKGEHYHAIKKKCCIERPVPSQVVTGTVLGKPKGLKSVATKVAIQMNCKLGGEPWNVAIPLKDTMVMGFDTYHDSVNKGTSVGALVSSTNNTFTKYSSSCIFHKTKEGGAIEITMGMKSLVMTALRRYKEANQSIPLRIIFFRDGVGEGQIEDVRNQEVKVIRETLQEAFKANNIDAPPKFTYIIVSKRINARFFSDGNRPGNPPSGTIVDDVVTLPERYDFFLISQSVRQGTVNPTSYNVIEDSGGLKAEHLQKLAYKLTHLYYNWPGTVRVPAPCQYAHKLAFLVGQSLHKSPDKSLEDKLFYL